MADALATIVGGSSAMGTPPFTASTTVATFALDASTDALEYILQTKDAITITRVGFRLGSITGTTPTYKVSIQGVDGSGLPDGTIKGGASPASATFSPSGLGWSASTWHWVDLANSYACGAGELIAIVIAYDSGTINGSNFCGFASNVGSPTIRFPYVIENNATVRTRQSTPPLIAYGGASSVYGWPVLAVNSRAIASTTGTADEYGCKFTLPAAWGRTYTVRGIRLPITLAAGTSVKVGLYGGTDATVANSTGATTETTEFQGVTIDGDVAASTSAGNATILFDETTLTTLYFGGTYRISLQPQNATAITCYTFTTDAAADMDGHALGQNMVCTKRLDVGNWTDVTTERTMMELILGDITKPTGGQRLYA